jgi:hypothetical protein
VSRVEFQAANPIDRFAIGDRDDLRSSPDGPHGAPARLQQRPEAVSGDREGFAGVPPIVHDGFAGRRDSARSFPELTNPLIYHPKTNSARSSKQAAAVSPSEPAEVEPAKDGTTAAGGRRA